MTTLTIDFESYYSNEFSLSKMTTQQYIYDAQFEVICVCVKRDHEPTLSFTGTMPETKQWLDQFPWEDSLCIAHNAQFDGLILAARFGIHPKLFHCTMLGANALSKPFNGSASLKKTAEFYKLGAKGTEVLKALGKKRKHFDNRSMAAYIRYCRQDVDLCHAIFLRQAPLIPKVQRMLISLTVRKVTRPVLKLNRDLLVSRLMDVRQQKKDLLVRCGLPNRDALMSNDKFAALLSRHGVIPPMKISPTTKQWVYAFAKTDAAMESMLEHDNPLIQALVAARVGVKSTQEETRLERFIAVADTKAPMGMPLVWFGAHTGRFSGGDKLNVQNLHRGGELRRALVAQYGMRIVAGDLSQIEARVVATLAGCQQLIDAFTSGDDVYSLFASELYGRPINAKDDPDERRMGKTAILGLGFQMGPERFRESCRIVGIDVTLAEAKRVVDLYRDTFPEIPRFWRQCGRLLEHINRGSTVKLGPVTTTPKGLRLPNGLHIYYPQLRKDEEGFIYKGRYKATRIYSGKVCENIVQALAQIVVGTAEVKLAMRGLYAATQSHDELVYVVLDKHVPAVTKALEVALTAPVPWLPDLPLACEINTGDNYAECK